MSSKLSISCFIFIFIVVITVNGFAEDASYETGSTWYKSPMLAVMTGFIYEPLSKFSFDEWRENLGSEFNADEFVNTLKEAGVDYLIYYDKWIDGYVWHDTKTTKFKSSRDFIKEIAQACHKHGLRLVFYFNPVSDNNPEFAKWAIKDRFGNKILFMQEWPMMFGNLHDQDFRKASLEQLTELVSNYGTIDGIWIDDSPTITFAARNKSVIQAFERKFRKSFDKASFDEIKELSLETRAKYLEDARKISKKHQKDAVFTINASLQDNTYDIINKQLDYWMIESCTLDKTDFHAHKAHFCPRPAEIGSLINSNWYVPLKNDPPPMGRGSEKQVVSEAALALCRGASIYLAITPGHSGKYGQDLQAVHEAGQWYKKLEPYIQNAQPYADVAVILGTPSLGGKGLPSKNEFWLNFNKEQCIAVIEAISICEDIETAGAFSKVLYAQADYSNWPKTLSQFKAVILPERVMLDPKHIQIIRDYVKNGGSLISFGHATYLDENGTKRTEFALGDVFAIQEIRWNGAGGKILFNEALRKKYFSDQTFDTLLNVININTGPSTEIIATIGDGASVPAVVRNSYGNGKSFYFTTGEAAFRGNRTFWKGLTQMILGEPAVIIDNNEIHDRKDAMPYTGICKLEKGLNRYCTILNETPKGKVLHIIDREGGSSTVTVSLAQSSVGDVDEATLIELGQNVLWIKKDNRFEITVPCEPVASIVYAK